MTEHNRPLRATLIVEHNPCVTDEVTEAFQPGAECVVCRRALGRGPLAVNVLPLTETVAVAYATHRACAHGPIDDTTQTTYFAGRGILSSARCDTVERTAYIIVNPSAEIFAVHRIGPRLWGDPLRRYRDAGYRIDRAPAILEGSSRPPSLVSWSGDGTHIVVHDRISQARFVVEVCDSFLQLVRERGGFVYTITFRHWAAELFADTAAMDAYLDDPAGSVHIWVPMSSMTGT